MENKQNDNQYDGILKKLDSLENKINEISAQKYESEELNELYTALSKAQMEMSTIKPSSINPFFKSKYADLAKIVSACRPALAKNGLCVIQRTLSRAGRTYLFTRLAHSSGQWISSNMIINPPKSDIQSIGSYITYLKRYEYAAMVNAIVTDEDDDGEAAMKPIREKKAVKSTVTKDQTQILAKELEGDSSLLKNILNAYGIQKLSDIPSNQFEKCLNRIKQIKGAKDD